MHSKVDSTDRTAVDYVLFASTFFGSLILLAGVEISSPAIAVLGFVIELSSVLLAGLRE